MVVPTMNSDPMTVRTKVAVELGIIAVLTIAFLLLFPHRNPWFDVGLAGFALLCIGASAGYTKKRRLGSIAAATRPEQIQTVRKNNAVGDGANRGGISARWRNSGLPERWVARGD